MPSDVPKTFEKKITHEINISKIQEYDPIAILNEIPTQSTAHLYRDREFPYRNANKELLVIDPLELGDTLKFSAKYVLTDSLKNIKKISDDYQEKTGEPLSSSQSLCVVMGDDGQESYRHAPIILEEWVGEDGNKFLFPADGNNQMFDYLSKDPPEKFVAIVISNIDEKYRPTYQPVDYSEVAVVDTPPKLDGRRKFSGSINPATYQDNRPDFNVFGSKGARSTRDEKIDNTIYRIQEGVMINQNLAEQIHQGYAEFAPPPSDQIAAKNNEHGEAEVVDFAGITRLSEGIGMAYYRVKTVEGNVFNFRLLVKDKKDYQENATAAVTILNEDQVTMFENETTRPKGEFNCSPEVNQLINSQLAELNCGISDFSLKSSENPNAPNVVGVEIWNEGSQYYTPITLKLSDGSDITITRNRQHIDKYGIPNSGSVLAVRDKQGNYLLGWRHRLPTGRIVETARAFENSKEKLEAKFGASIIRNLDLVNEIVIDGVESVDNTPHNYQDFQCNLDDFTPSPDADDVLYQHKPPEIENITRLTPEQINHAIASGVIVDTHTISSIVWSQLVNNTLRLNEFYQNKSILMEKVFDPQTGYRFIIPKVSIDHFDPNARKYADLGKSTHVEYTRELQPKELLKYKSTKKLVPIKLSDLTQMCQNGQIDYVSFAHLSSILLRDTVWITNKQTGIQAESAQKWWEQFSIGK